MGRVLTERDPQEYAPMASQFQLAGLQLRYRAELLVALIGCGMLRRDGVEVVRRVGRHPQLRTNLLGTFEVGLPPHSLGSPVRDALVAGAAFIVGSVIPLLPFLVFQVQPSLIVTIILASPALFVPGALTTWLSERRLLVGGLEVMLMGRTVSVIGYLLGRLAFTVFGFSLCPLRLDH
ncbi:MAG TPA: VIT1/CCC1 transporter family protein [Methylomirabilota bacterium]|nr:VIT1/CCC1 transporter family protein [Methylomirabilota bacterium]